MGSTYGYNAVIDLEFTQMPKKRHIKHVSHMCRCSDGIREGWFLWASIWTAQ